MDLEAISSLRDGIQTFPGTCIFVTHDRDLIETVANKIVVVEPGKIEVYPGGWDEYRKSRKG
jgi:ATP-binding cassette subfamily F protein 3